MATDTGKRNEMRRALLSVINTLHDSQKAFAEIGDHLKDDAIKKYFLAESLKRAQFRGDLEEVLHQNGVHDINESGTAVGTLNRVWGDLKAKLGGGDPTLLATAEQGEDAVKETYEDALRQELPLPILQRLTEQQAHILDSHNYVKSQRDAALSK